MTSPNWQMLRCRRLLAFPALWTLDSLVVDEVGPEGYPGVRRPAKLHRQSLLVVFKPTRLRLAAHPDDAAARAPRRHRGGLTHLTRSSASSSRMPSATFDISSVQSGPAGTTPRLCSLRNRASLLPRDSPTPRASARASSQPQRRARARSGRCLVAEACGADERRLCSPTVSTWSRCSRSR